MKTIAFVGLAAGIVCLASLSVLIVTSYPYWNPTYESGDSDFDSRALARITASARVVLLSALTLLGCGIKAFFAFAYRNDRDNADTSSERDPNDTP